MPQLELLAPGGHRNRDTPPLLPLSSTSLSAIVHMYRSVICMLSRIKCSIRYQYKIKVAYFKRLEDLHHCLDFFICTYRRSGTIYKPKCANRNKDTETCFCYNKIDNISNNLKQDRNSVLCKTTTDTKPISLKKMDMEIVRNV